MYIIIFAILCLTHISIRQVFLAKKQEATIRTHMQIYVERIQNTVSQSIERGLLLESIIRYLEPAFNENTYNYIAGDFFDENTMISISYMPEGIVKWIYPPSEDNINVLGLNVFEFEGTKEGAYESKRSGQIMISGPFLLQSGEMGLTIRSPIYLVDNTFWGFVSILYDPISIAFAALETKDLDILGYEYAIHSSYNGEKTPLINTENFDYSKAFYSPLTVENNTWDFYLYDSSFESQRISLFLMSLIESVGICAILSLLIYIRKRRITSIHNQIYYDPLTKLYNRKKVESYLDDKNINKERGFTLFYLDLNKFKPVNDTYGHLIGDKLLTAFALRMQNRFDSNKTAIRLGGDEFALIINSELDSANIQRIIQRIESMAEEVFFIDTLQIEISTSVGYAQYPTDGTDMQTLLKIADKKMYEHKQKQKLLRE